MRRPETGSVPELDVDAPAGRSSGARPGPWSQGWPDIEGHRGARGLVVENTLPSISAALAAGVRAVEIDVRMTADGHLVVWHDPVLLAHKCRSTGEDLTGARIDDLPLAQLRTVDVGSQTLPQFPGQLAAPGERIPTLADVLALGEQQSPGVWWTVEVKSNPTDARQVANRARLVAATHAAIGEAGIERRCLVHSFDWAVLDLSRELAPDLLRSALVEATVTYLPGSPWTGSVPWERHGDDLCAAVADLGAHVVSPEYVLVDEALVARAHELGVAVLPWTVNEDADLRAMLALGVDGIVTDYPDRALALARS